jgi:hypothetical protein
MTTFYCLKFATPPSWRTRSSYLYHPRNKVARLYPQTLSCLSTDHHGWTTYVSRPTHRKYIRCPVIDIYESHRRHLFFSGCIYSALKENGIYPIVVRCRGNVFTESLLSNGSTCHNTNGQYGASLLVQQFGRTSGSARNVARTFSMGQSVYHLHIYTSCTYMAK